MPPSDPTFRPLVTDHAPPPAEVERMKRLELRYRALLADRAQIFWLMSPDGSFIASPAWCEFTGQAAEALRAGGALAAVHPDDRALVAQVWRSALAARAPVEVECRFRRLDGVYRWFVTRGHPVQADDGGVQAWIGWSRDIDQERRSPDALCEQAAQIEAAFAVRAQALGKSEAMLAESQRLAKIGSFELEVATNQLIWSDQQFRNFGLRPAPVVDRAEAVARIHPEDVDRHEVMVRRALAHGEAFAMDYRVFHPDGRIRHIHTIAQPALDTDGRVVRIVGTSQDVTERKRTEHELRAANVDLQRLGLLKDDFIATVSHELRSPITAIKNAAAILKRGRAGPLTEKQAPFVEMIADHVKRLIGLVDDILDIQTLDNGRLAVELQPEDLRPIVRDLAEGFAHVLAAKAIALEVSLAAQPLVARVDRRRLEQVLSNLLSNAVKFTPSGGRVRVEAYAQGAEVVLAVSDTGIGVAPEDAKRIFEKFVQLEDVLTREAGGSGLGLAICKRLVEERHGGRIWMESELGHGSRFLVALPRHGA
jgi:PAS domain S-box-containing protein